MKVCLPGGREWNVKPVCDQRPKNADVTRPRDLNYIRFEFAHAVCGFPIMFGKEKVEMMISIQRKCREASPQLNSGHGSVALYLSPRACVNHQKRNTLAASKCLKVSRGIRESVHLVIPVRKIGDPYARTRHKVASEGKSEGWWDPSSCVSITFNARPTESFSARRKMEKIFSIAAGGLRHRADRGCINSRGLPG